MYCECLFSQFRQRSPSDVCQKSTNQGKWADLDDELEPDANLSRYCGPVEKATLLYAVGICRTDAHNLLPLFRSSAVGRVQRSGHRICGMTVRIRKPKARGS